MTRRKKPTAPPPAPDGRSPVRRAVVVLLTLGLVAAVLIGMSLVGDAARRHLGPRDRYAVRFADVRCDPPPGTTRETFLAEVRFLAGAPETIQSLDPELNAKLAGAFAAHPWVARVHAVAVEPPDVVTVTLTYRTPALAVAQPTGKRVVDAKGVLLPLSAPSDGLPELLGVPELPPTATAGQPWPSDAVVRAAAVATEYRPKTLERTPQGWQLVMPDGRKLVVSAN